MPLYFSFFYKGLCSKSKLEQFGELDHIWMFFRLCVKLVTAYCEYRKMFSWLQIGL